MANKTPFKSLVGKLTPATDAINEVEATLASIASILFDLLGWTLAFDITPVLLILTCPTAVDPAARAD